MEAGASGEPHDSVVLPVASACVGNTCRLAKQVVLVPDAVRMQDEPVDVPGPAVARWTFARIRHEDQGRCVVSSSGKGELAGRLGGSGVP